MLRKNLGISQEKAAERCTMATQLLQRIESATTNVTATTLARLSDGFGVDIVVLFAPPVQGAQTRGKKTSTEVMIGAGHTEGKGSSSK
jgi:transcriptional regulator with XRE-family HTH domain